MDKEMSFLPQQWEGAADAAPPIILFSSICLLSVFMCIATSAHADFNPFAAYIIDDSNYPVSLNGPNEPHYLPAPGQRVNVSPFYFADKTLGSPSGGGTRMPNNDEIITLGGFGGHIVLAFDHNVENNPANPMGLDAIVFSNTLWNDGDPNLHWAELATIEIMPEINGDNIPATDPCEIWYIIAGSHLPDPCSWRIQFWDSDDPDLYGYPNFSGTWPDTYETSAFELFPAYEDIGDEEEPIWVLPNPYWNDGNSTNNHLEGYWGYAEYTPTLILGDRNADNSAGTYGDDQEMPEELYYTFPDNPLTVGIDDGACGGDAFDISWAVDPNTWQPVNLASFRYIRITTAVDERSFGFEGVLGEISAEIDAVSDVRPYGDINGDNEVDFVDLGLLAQAWLSEWPDEDFNPAADFMVDNIIDFYDYARFAFGFQNEAP